MCVCGYHLGIPALDCLPAAMKYLVALDNLAEPAAKSQKTLKLASIVRNSIMLLDAGFEMAGNNAPFAGIG